MRPTLFTLVSLVFAGFAARLLPHAWNFTPVIAMALLAGAYARPRWLALALPLSALWLSDLALNNLIWAEYYNGFQWFGNWGVYAAMAITAGLPLGLSSRAADSKLGLVGLGIAGALTFYLVSNFAVWASGGMYAPTAAGLVACLAAGLPFLANSLASTLVFGAMGVYLLERVRERQLESAHVAA